MRPLGGDVFWSGNAPLAARALRAADALRAARRCCHPCMRYVRAPSVRHRYHGLIVHGFAKSIRFDRGTGWQVRPRRTATILAACAAPASRPTQPPQSAREDTITRPTTLLGGGAARGLDGGTLVIGIAKGPPARSTARRPGPRAIAPPPAGGAEVGCFGWVAPAGLLGAAPAGCKGRSPARPPGRLRRRPGLEGREGG